MCMWAVTSECRSSDSDRTRAAMISAARSSSPRPSPQPSGRRRTGPYMGSDHGRTRALQVIPNRPPHPPHTPTTPLTMRSALSRSGGGRKAGGRGGAAPRDGPGPAWTAGSTGSPRAQLSAVRPSRSGHNTRSAVRGVALATPTGRASPVRPRPRPSPLRPERALAPRLLGPGRRRTPDSAAPGNAPAARPLAPTRDESLEGLYEARGPRRLAAPARTSRV